MKFKLLFKVMLCVLLFASCAPVTNISYFQDAEDGVGIETVPTQDIRFMPDDKLSVIVHTKDQLLDALFNLSVASRQISNASSIGTQSYVTTYTVNPNGDIDFPVLGFVPVAGKSRFEVSQDIKSRLVEQKLVNDPVVTVEFSGLYVSVLGEVSRPGRYEIDRDKLTLPEALSKAGDLSIYGKRENVTVIREVDGKQVTYVVNMLDMANLYSSPVFYLQQNDVVYVEPNAMRARQSTVNGNNLYSTSFWISVTSLLVTILNLIY